MAARKSFLIRVRPELLEGLRVWAEQEMRSVNGQIEWALRDALRRRGRGPGGERVADDGDEDAQPPDGK